MPLSSYGVLVGRVIDTRREGTADTPHFQIHARAAGMDYRIAVNVLSQQSPSELLYTTIDGFTHPLLPRLDKFEEGFTTVASAGEGVALDFIRGNLFDRGTMRAVPAEEPGPDNDLADMLEHFSRRAALDPAARVYAFGERWGPEDTTPDKVFGFTPGNGVHDIHMNQGNSGRFVGDDGVWQDGGVLLQFPETGQWVAMRGFHRGTRPDALEKGGRFTGRGHFQLAGKELLTAGTGPARRCAARSPPAAPSPAGATPRPTAPVPVAGRYTARPGRNRRLHDTSPAG